MRTREAKRLLKIAKSQLSIARQAKALGSKSNRVEEYQHDVDVLEALIQKREQGQLLLAYTKDLMSDLASANLAHDKQKADEVSAKIYELKKYVDAQLAAYRKEETK